MNVTSAQGPSPRAPRTAMGTAFTYQGQLKSGGSAYSGNCDFQFSLYGSSDGSDQIGTTQTAGSVSVASGLFTTPIDFGASAFNGDARWLAIGVRCPAGSGSYTPLTSRQQLTAAPYALYATTASTSTTAGSVTGVVPLENGGTGLSATGSSGNYLRSNGSSWASSAIQASDVPSGSANYIQNTTSAQSSANFNISGSGTLGGNLNLPNSSSTVGVLYLGGNRFLHKYGSNNTFVGSLAGNFTMTGNSNTAVGTNALQANSSGGSNTAVGFEALLHNDSNSLNTAVGKSALTLSTGYNNTAVGASALSQITTGNNNIALGNTAGTNYTFGNSNNIAIGNTGNGGESNAIRIGNTQTTAYIAGINGVTVAGGTTVLINGSGQLGTIVSSRRFKENIQDMGQASQVLYQLRPVTFHYKEEFGDPDERQAGLIAEEVAKIAPWMVVNDKEGQPYTVRYEMLAPMLLNEIQKQQGTIANQENVIRDQASSLAQLRTQVASLQEEKATTAGRLDALEAAMKKNGISVASNDRPTAMWALESLGAPAWFLIGMVGLMVAQRARWGGRR